MTPEVRRAAVRMAAKAAALVVTVNAAAACSGGGKKAGPANTTDTGNGSVPAAGDCGPYLDGLAVIKPSELPEGDPLKGKPGVYGAFKDAAARSAEQTQTCCKEALAKERSQSKHRWECCSATADADGAACTPWGPPCPPEMFLLS